MLLLFIVGCRKDEDFTTDSSAKLSFSTDTVMFDTVFSQVEQNRPLSITKQFWVINTNDKGVKVNIRLAGNQYGIYKLNIDGLPTTAIAQKEIRGNDSIAIFVQVYLNAVNQNTPFIVTDQILFETNGNTQDVDLVAFAQDAIYLKNEVLNCANGNLHWTADKPYVIYDSILVPEGCNLTIDAGTRVHSHNQSSLLVAGTLIVNGTLQKPVIFEGDRLDADYRDRTGQWAGIHILRPSIDNVIRYAVIKNCLIGVRVDSLSNNQNPKLLLQDSKINKALIFGVLGLNADFTAINNEITNCGSFTFFARYGGNYQLYYNTFANYGFDFNRQNEQFLLDNGPIKNEAGAIVSVNALKVTMLNNIVYGSREEELLITNDVQGGPVNYILQNNLFRTKITSLNVNGNILNQDPGFVNPSESNYTLKETSAARKKAIPISTIPKDLLAKPRDGVTPTIGAYE